MSLLYPAAFPTHWAVQFWYTFQGTVAMGMGLVGFFYPDTPAITEGGVWTNEKGKKKVAPNVRGWALRNAFAGLVNFMAFYFGTKDTYLIMIAVALWRETFDIIECYFLEPEKAHVVFNLSKVPPGKFPPLPYFPPYALLMVGNLATLYHTLVIAK